MARSVKYSRVAVVSVLAGLSITLRVIFFTVFVAIVICVGDHLLDADAQTGVGRRIDAGPEGHLGELRHPDGLLSDLAEEVGGADAGLLAREEKTHAQQALVVVMLGPDLLLGVGDGDTLASLVLVLAGVDHFVDKKNNRL